MDRLEEIKAALEGAKTFIGSIVVVRGYGDEQYGEICKVLASLESLQSDQCAERTEFKPCAFYNSDMDEIEFVTKDVTISTEWVDDNFAVLRRMNTREIIGLKINCPLAYAKQIAASPAPPVSGPIPDRPGDYSKQAIADKPVAQDEKNGWQDISTAPKDGTEIIVTDGKTPCVVHWIKYSNPLLGGIWQGNYYDGYDYEYISGSGPTHWQPLHPLPEKS